MLHIQHTSGNGNCLFSALLQGQHGGCVPNLAQQHTARLLTASAIDVNDADLAATVIHHRAEDCLDRCGPGGHQDDEFGEAMFAGGERHMFRDLKTYKEMMATDGYYTSHEVAFLAIQQHKLNVVVVGVGGFILPPQPFPCGSPQEDFFFLVMSPEHHETGYLTCRTMFPGQVPACSGLCKDFRTQVKCFYFCGGVVLMCLFFLLLL